MEVVEHLNRRYMRELSETKKEEGMEGYRSRMLCRNKLTGLVPMDKRYMDGQSYVYYDITGLLSLQEREKHIRITETMMDEIVFAMEHLLQELERYLLKADEVCFCPEYVFQEEESEKWFFLYMPEEEMIQKGNLERLLEFIMDHLECEDDNSLERFYDFYSQALQEAEKLNIRTFVRLWNRGNKDKEASEQVSDRIETDILPEQPDLFEEVTEMEQETERIYRVPYRGIKIRQMDSAALT